MAEWYFSRDGAQLGPVTLEELKRQIQAGTLTRETLIWKEDMVEWTPAGQVKEVFSVPPPLPAAAKAPPPLPNTPAPSGPRRTRHFEVDSPQPSTGRSTPPPAPPAPPVLPAASHGVPNRTPRPPAVRSASSKQWIIGSIALVVVLLIGAGLSRRSPGSDFSQVDESVIASLINCCEAQDIYRYTDWDGDGVMEFSQSLRGPYSLYEKNAGTGDLLLISPDLAAADCIFPDAVPYTGYFFMVLTGQGDQAAGGRRSYLKDDNMVYGYAVLAVPAEYGTTGRYTYLINFNREICRKDFGPETPSLVRQITEFNPDNTWEPVALAPNSGSR